MNEITGIIQGQFPSDEPFLNYMFCMSQRMKFQNPDGSLNREVIEKRMSK